MSEVVPLFKSHYSLGRSILTLDKVDSSIENGPDSIVDICAKNDLGRVTLLDDNMSGFLEAYLNSQETGLQLNFGLRLRILDDCEDKSEGSLGKTCKYVIFAKNEEGYKRLIKIYSHAARIGFYYFPRIDFKSLKQYWSNKDLKFCVPFYDSFVFRNCLEYSSCVPELDYVEPTFFVEDNGLPFDNMVAKRVEKFCEGKYPTQKVKSIFYKDEKDFKSYLTFRCINNRTTLDKPNFEHMCSDKFSFESWKNGTV